jgi:hypothetical protein
LGEGKRQPEADLAAESASDPAWNGIADDWHKNPDYG